MAFKPLHRGAIPAEAALGAADEAAAAAQKLFEESRVLSRSLFESLVKGSKSTIPISESSELIRRDFVILERGRLPILDRLSASKTGHQQVMAREIFPDSKTLGPKQRIWIQHRSGDNPKPMPCAASRADMIITCHPQTFAGDALLAKHAFPHSRGTIHHSQDATTVVFPDGRRKEVASFYTSEYKQLYSRAKRSHSIFAQAIKNESPEGKVLELRVDADNFHFTPAWKERAPAKVLPFAREQKGFKWFSWYAESPNKDPMARRKYADERLAEWHEKEFERIMAAEMEDFYASQARKRRV